MAAVESEADDKFANIDLESLLSRVGRRPLTFGKVRSLNKAPEFEKRLTGEETVNAGTTLQLETKVSGFPLPTLRWFKDDEEIVDHPRIHVESDDNGVFVFTLENVNKGDEAAYRCRAENVEGVSSCMFYLHVKVKLKSPKKSGKHLTKRTVSYPPMFPTIVEKVEEEEKAAKETARSPPSPLTQLYDGLTLQTRHTWPKFLGDWAYVENAHRNGESLGSETDSEVGDGHSLDSIEHDEVFSEDSCDKSSEGASFYLSSEDATPGTPDCFSGGINIGGTKEVISDLAPETVSGTRDINRNIGCDSRESDVVQTCYEISHIPINDKPQEDTVAEEPNNNEAKACLIKKDLRLPLSNGTLSTSDAKEGKENVQADKLKKKKEKETSVKKGDEKKKSSDKIKLPKKTTNEDKEKVEKPVKKTEKDKEKAVKKGESKEKVARKESSSTKKSDQSLGASNKQCDSPIKKNDSKEETKSKTKSTKPTTTEKKPSKKSDKKTDSPKRKSESKEKKDKCDYINNPDPPILGSARPLVFTNLASKLISCTSSSEKSDKGGDKSHDSTDIYSKHTQENTLYKQLNGDTVSYQGNTGIALVPTPIGDVPFGRYFEEFIFVVCLFTFLSLCIGIPSETFVLIILGMHFFYSMVTILGLC